MDACLRGGAFQPIGDRLNRFLVVSCGADEHAAPVRGEILERLNELSSCRPDRSLRMDQGTVDAPRAGAGGNSGEQLHASCSCMKDRFLGVKLGEGDDNIPAIGDELKRLQPAGSYLRSDEDAIWGDVESRCGVAGFELEFGATLRIRRQRLSRRALRAYADRSLYA